MEVIIEAVGSEVGVIVMIEHVVKSKKVKRSFAIKSKNKLNNVFGVAHQSNLGGLCNIKFDSLENPMRHKMYIIEIRMLR